MNTLLIEKLSTFDKIFVTGPPRSGTTITSLILAKELNYKFIDETLYDGSDQHKLYLLLHHPRKMVIHNTSFTRDIHQFFFSLPTCIVLVKREIDDIIDSMDNTIKFMTDKDVYVGEKGMFNGFNQDAREMILEHFGYKNTGLSVPEAIYDHFYSNMNPNKDYQIINYPDDIKDHPLFIKKSKRRKRFTNIKQVNFDPNYLEKTKGILVL